MLLEDPPFPLTPHVQLCLAHYCDLHGPTPLMVTEGLPVPCGLCYEDDEAGAHADDHRPRTASAQGGPASPVSGAASPITAEAQALAETLRRLTLGHGHGPRSVSMSATEQDAQTHRAALLRAAAAAAATANADPSAPVSSSPTSHPSPTSPTVSENGTPRRRDSSFHKTYDEYVTKRASPCDNCALTLPKRLDGSGSGIATGKADMRGPTLRSRAPFSRVYGSGMPRASSPQSQASSESESNASEDTDGDSAGSNDERDRRRHVHHRGSLRAHPHRRSTATVASRSSLSSSGGRVDSHTHYLDYISTHEPVVPNSFTIVRASCLRTLSFETLPRAAGPTSSGPHSVFAGPSYATYNPYAYQPSASIAAATASIAPSLPSHFVTTHSAGSTASGGPIFFGDPLAGYTTAYIFRIPDVHARGHRRVYAFIALSTHRERLAMKTFGFVANAFRELAAWVQALAEAEAERVAEQSPIGGSMGMGYGSFAPSSAQSQAQQEREAANHSGSSFLSGGSAFTRRMGGGGGGPSLKQRGLAELVGLPDFFIELHRRFVTLLLELGVLLNS